MKTAAGQVDLLAWPELRDAEARVREADAAVDLAQRRVLHAGHGQLRGRRAELLAATRAALIAAVALADLRARLRGEGRA